MEYVIYSDIKPLIDYQSIKVPSCPLLEQQYKLHAFGFVLWLNHKGSGLTTKQKQLLTDFRSVNFDYTKLNKIITERKLEAWDDLHDAAKQLQLTYPKYQKWLQRRIKAKNSYLASFPYHKTYLLLATPVRELKLGKTMKDPIVKSGFRSLHEMFLKKNFFEWRKEIIITESAFKSFHSFMVNNKMTYWINVDERK